jgi:hypothetical protein
MQKFEYLVMLLNTDGSLKTMEDTTGKLTEKGSEGWDLVSVVLVKGISGDKSFFYFKRPISN